MRRRSEDERNERRDEAAHHKACEDAKAYPEDDETERAFTAVIEGAIAEDGFGWVVQIEARMCSADLSHLFPVGECLIDTKAMRWALLMRSGEAFMRGANHA